MAAEASVSETESILIGMRVLEAAVGSSFRESDVGALGSLVAAMTVVEGRFRRVWTRPRPIPVMW